MLSLLPALVVAEPAPLAVVLASTAPGYAMGDVLAEAVVEVPDGASSTFLLPSGQMVTVKGPYAGELAGQKRAASPGGLTQFLIPGQDSSEIGGSRSFEPGRTAGTLTLDPAAGGIFCVSPETAVMLAHPADPTFDRVELRQRSGGPAVRLDWPATGEALAWPSALPLDTGIVTVTSRRTGAERQLQLRLVGRAGRSDAARAAALALAGCSRQAAAVLDRLRQAVVPLDLYLGSSRGRYPVYRTGEPVELVVQTNRDAFLYCMVRDARGQATLLFPPQASGAKLAGHRAMTLPGSPLAQPLLAGAELMDSEIRCIASERELAAALPQLAGPGPLSEATIAALDEAVADPRQGRIVMAQLIVRVED
jgi:hypothetical protein